MAILDRWSNPLSSPNATAIGYRGELEEFPHDLYSFLLSTIREADQQEIALLYRWMRPQQMMWEEQYALIYSLFDLLSPERCPEEWLDFLKKKVGITDDLSYIWSTLSTTEKRRFIKYFVRFLIYRGTSFGLEEMMTTMTGYPVWIRGFFFYRWLLSGNSDGEILTALGREDEDNDPWLISEEDVPLGVRPDDVEILTDSGAGTDYYKFTVNTLVSQVTNPPIQKLVIVRCRSTGVSIIDLLKHDGIDYYVRTDNDYFFDQPDSNHSETPQGFLVSFESSPYVSDILVIDDGEANREMIRGLARFSRPMSERFYIRYYNMLDKFESLDAWVVDSGTATLNEDDNNVVIGDSVLSALRVDYLSSADWNDYGFIVRGQLGVANRYAEIRFMYKDSLNYYYVKFGANSPPVWPPGAWILGRVVAGVDTPLIGGDCDQLDLDIDYVWRVECVTSARPANDVQIIRVYQDENQLVDYVDNPVPWTSVEGTVQLVVQSNGEWTVSKFMCHPIPMDYDLIAPTV